MATSEKQHQRDRVTLCGSFGLGNAGDDAAYLAVEDLARALGLQVEFDVATRFPVADDPSVLSLGPADAERRASLRGQPLLYLGGGIIEPRESATLFRTRRLVRELRPDDCNLFAASADSHRFVQYDWSARLALLGVLRHCRRLFARDVLSAETIRMLAPFRRVEVVGDIVLWMNPDGDPPPQIAALGRYITVSLAGVWRGEITWYEWLSRQLAEIARSLDASIGLFRTRRPACAWPSAGRGTTHAQSLMSRASRGRGNPRRPGGSIEGSAERVVRRRA
jgi:hypothetical protein